MGTPGTGPGRGPGNRGPGTGGQFGPGNRPGGGGQFGQGGQGQRGGGNWNHGNGNWNHPNYHNGRYYYNNYPGAFFYGFWGLGLGLALGSSLYYSPFYDYGLPYVYAPSVVYQTVPAYTYTEVPAYAYGNGYYMSPGQYSGLDDAIGDIRSAWTSGRADLLLSHIDSGMDVAVYLDGKYSYSVKGTDYGNMVRDAVGHIRTTSFTITNVEQRSDGAYQVLARHEFYDANNNIKTADVSFTLAQRGGRWVIVAVGSSTPST